MASPFDVFNRTTLALRRVTNASGGEYNTSSVWVPSTKTPTVIAGHISMVDRFGRESAWRQSPAGPVEAGQLRLFTETLLEKGEILEADQEAGVVYRYKVLDLVRAHRLMALKLGTPVRYEFAIFEVPR